MIGILDENFITAKRGLPPPSLAAMKMATHLKTTQKSQVVLLQNFQVANNCEKVYLFSDKTYENLPKEVLNITVDLEMYGPHLSPVPQLVEHLIPDITIYNNVVQERLNSRLTSTSRALQFLDSIYYQAYGANGERLPLPPSETRKRFYLYDIDFLQYENCWNIFDEIIERAPSGIYTIHPLQCHTLKQFFTLREDYEKVSRSNKVVLDYFVPLHQFDTYFSKYKLKLLGEITKTSEVYIYLGKNYSNNAYGETFYSKNIYYCLNLLFSYWSRNIPIKTELFEVEGTFNPYKDIYNCIRLWANSDNYDLKVKDSFNSKKLLAQLEEFLKIHPVMAPLFEKTKNDLIHTRGIWRI